MKQFQKTVPKPVPAFWVWVLCALGTRFWVIGLEQIGTKCICFVLFLNSDNKGNGLILLTRLVIELVQKTSLMNKVPRQFQSQFPHQVVCITSGVNEKRVPAAGLDTVESFIRARQRGWVNLELSFATTGVSWTPWRLARAPLTSGCKNSLPECELATTTLVYEKQTKPKFWHKSYVHM